LAATLRAGPGLLRQQALTEVNPFFGLAEAVAQVFYLTSQLQQFSKDFRIATAGSRLDSTGQGLANRTLKDPDQAPSQETGRQDTRHHCDNGY